MIEQLLIVAGSVIVVAALLQILLLGYDMMRRVAHHNVQRRHAVALLDLQIEAARERREKERRRGLDWAGWRKFRVREKVPEDGNREVCSFYLEPHDGKAIPQFEPGQFLTFKLDTGDAQPTVRCYSLSDCPRTGQYRVTIKRVPAPRGTDHPPGRSSNYFHDQVQVGDILDVSAPNGDFFLDRLATTPVVLIGGGVGITPVLSMLNAIVDDGGSRNTWFFYGVRHGGEHIMKRQLQEMQKVYEQIRVRVCYSDPKPEDVPGRDFDHDCRVSVELLKQVLPSSNFEFYVCGPPPMMDAITRDLAEWGVPEHKIHTEKFGPGPPAKPAQPAEGEQAGPEIRFRKSGKKIDWFDGCPSLLQLAEQHGITIPSGCWTGNCGTCQTAILSGSVKYTKKPSFAYQPGTCLPCCCVPEEPVELDA